MKKICYNSWIARHFLFPSYSTITLAAWVCTKFKTKETMPQYVRNHECTHARQWTEMFLLTGALIWFISLFVEISPWLYLVAVLAFYLLYVVEWLIRLLINGREAYKYVSFEREAQNAQYNETYLENTNYFVWVKYLFRK